VFVADSVVGSRRGRVRDWFDRDFVATVLLCSTLFACAPAPVLAQDIEPRVQSAAPVGTNIAGLSFAHSWGAVLVDKTIPVEDLDGFTTALVPSLSHYFSFFGLTSRVDAFVPFVTGEWTAELGGTGQESSLTQTGLGDPSLRLAVFVIGAKAMTAEQFRDHRRSTVLGLHLRVMMPLGQYDEDRAINLGSNRWRITPAAGLSQPFGRWVAEVYGAVWFFSDNENFQGGGVLGQNPIAAFQLNLAYNFRPRMWLALGSRQTVGGRTTVNGTEQDDPEINNRLGLVLGMPVSTHQTIKLIGSTSTTATKGTDFNTVSVQWYYSW
jgi:hypothetical protein